MTSISFHKAKLNDIKTLVDLRILFALELSGEQTSDKIEALRLQMKRYFKSAIEENTCISYIAMSGEIIAGIGSVAIREQPGNFKNPSGKWGYIMNMYTVPEFRRKGVCRGILNCLINDVKSIGINAFELHATKDGEFIYKQEGFQIHIEPTYRKFV